MISIKRFSLLNSLKKGVPIPNPPEDGQKAYMGQTSGGWDGNLQVVVCLIF